MVDQACSFCASRTNYQGYIAGSPNWYFYKCVCGRLQILEYYSSNPADTPFSAIGSVTASTDPVKDYNNGGVPS